MRKDLADITLVVDRSGSMATCKEESTNGINHFIETQKKERGDCNFTLVQFDTEYEFVHNGTPIGEVGKFELEPRGMTALLDAVGRAINETGERLSKMKEEERPGLVIFMVVTDGHENSSHEFQRTQVRDMINRQRNEYSWEFMFLGASDKSFTEGIDLGFTVNSSAVYDTAKSQGTYAIMSDKILRARGDVVAGSGVDMTFSNSERSEIS